MWKSGQLFCKLARATFSKNLSQIRCKTQCMDSAMMPVPFRGVVSIVVKSPYSVKIEPLDPVEHANLQVAVGFLYMKTDGEQDIPAEVKTRFQKDIKYKVQSVMSPTRDFLEVTCSKQQEFNYPPENIYIHFYVPVDYGVEIEVSGQAEVDVSDLEGHIYEIITDQGSCHMSNLRGSRLSVETSGGDIICNSQLLFEFGILQTKRKGKVSVKKLQGRKFCVDTEEGNTDIRALYLLRAELTSNNGQVKLGDIHGLTEVETEKGDITIGSASGKLKAVSKSGNIHASLSKHEDVVLKTEQGSVDAKILEESVSSELIIKSKTVCISSNVNMTVDEEDKGPNFTLLNGRLNPNEEDQKQKTVKLEAKLGSVKLEKQDWFGTLKLR